MARRTLLGPLGYPTRYAHFEVEVTIHEILNVPIVEGEFSVAWRVKQAVPARRQGSSLERVDEVGTDGSSRSSSGAGDTMMRPPGAQRPPLTVLAPSAPADDAADQEAGDGASSAESPARPALTVSTAPLTRSTTPPERILADKTLVASPTVTLTSPTLSGSAQEPLPGSSSSSLSSSKTRAALAPMSKSPAPGASGLSRRGTRPRSLTSSSGSGTHRPLVPHKPLHGKTPFAGTHMYTAKWDERIQAMVRIGIRRAPAEADAKDSDSMRSADARGGQLHTSSMRLRVSWRRRDEAGSESLVRFGSLVLDLAEYAPPYQGAGAPPRTETRQYMLDDCKCNALLRLTIKTQFKDATHSYEVPPVHSGIMDPAAMAAGSQRLSARPDGRSDSLALMASAVGLVEQGLAWHYKLPLPVLFAQFAVPSEHLEQARGHHTPSARHGSLAYALSQDATQPRHAYCRVNTEALMDELFQGALGPVVDERDTSDAPPAHATRRGHMRWKKLVDAVKQNPRRAQQSGAGEAPGTGPPGPAHPLRLRTKLPRTLSRRSSGHKDGAATPETPGHALSS